jgi:N6-adenosine-specific RNA methylase IME4
VREGVFVTRYRTIVADPPWHYAPFPAGAGHAKATAERRGEQHDPLRKTPRPYRSMTLDEIKALPIQALADPSGAHLFLWTTSWYLRHAFDVLGSWGFRYSQTVVWVKTPMGLVPGKGTFATTAEFMLIGKIGVAPRNERWPTSWFHWPRQARHSQKPDAFLDLVEQVVPGPYVELFARRARFGWDYWGDQSLGTAEVAA